MTENLPAVTEDGQDDPLRALVLGWITDQRSVHTRRAYLRDIAGWLVWCAERDVGPLAATRPDAAGWARRLEAEGLAASTVARKLAAASSWYEWMIEQEHVSGNPFGRIKRPKLDRTTSSTPGLTRDQALAVLAAADCAGGPQHLRTPALVAVVLFTGARVSEVVGADIEDLTTDRGHRVLWVTRKGGKRQPLALPAPAAERLDAYLASRSDMASVPAVPGPPGGPRPRRVLFATETGARLFPADVRRLMQRLGNAAGLPADLVSHLGPHALRHSFATLYLDAGGSLRDLQDEMGHESADTTRRYDRARYSLDRSPGYLVASYLAGADA